MKRVSSTNDTVKTMKGKAIDLEKIFASHISDKGLAFQNKNYQNSAVRKWPQFLKMSEEGDSVVNSLPTNVGNSSLSPG